MTGIGRKAMALHGTGHHLRFEDTMAANLFSARFLVPLTTIALATTYAPAICAAPRHSTASLSASRFPVTKLRFTNDGRHLLVARSDSGIHGSLECWNASGSRIERVLQVGAAVSAIAFDDRTFRFRCSWRRAW